MSPSLAALINYKLNDRLALGGDVVYYSVQVSPDSSRVVYRADQDTDEVDELYASYDVPACDLEITKSVVPPGPVIPGQVLTYTLTFSNAGPVTATGVVITDVVPITLTNVCFTSNGVTITPTSGITYSWTVQDLAIGTTGTINITGVISPGLSADVVLTGTTTITATIFTNIATINATT